jgi:hypothetical protein
MAEHHTDKGQRSFPKRKLNHLCGLQNLDLNFNLVPRGDFFCVVANIIRRKVFRYPLTLFQRDTPFR